MTSILQLQKNDDTATHSLGNIVFDETLHQVGTVAYDSATGVITLSENGIYLLDWYVVTQSASVASNAVFQLRTDKGNLYQSNSPNKTGSTNGMAVLEVENAPVELSLVNASGGEVFFQNAMPAKAGLRLFRLYTGTADGACFALEQLSHVLEQLAALYPGTTVTLYSNRLGTLSGPLTGLYKSPNAAHVPLLLLGVEPYAINIDQISVLYFPEHALDPSITFLPLPDSLAQGCAADLLHNLHDYVSVGDTVTLGTGVNATASGTIVANEYGLLVLGDDTSMMLFPSLRIYFLTITSGGEGLRNTAKPPLRIRET